VPSKSPAAQSALRPFVKTSSRLVFCAGSSFHGLGTCKAASLFLARNEFCSDDHRWNSVSALICHRGNRAAYSVTSTIVCCVLKRRTYLTVTLSKSRGQMTHGFRELDGIFRCHRRKIVFTKPRSRVHGLRLMEADLLLRGRKPGCRLSDALRGLRCIRRAAEVFIQHYDLKVFSQSGSYAQRGMVFTGPDRPVPEALFTRAIGDDGKQRCHFHCCTEWHCPWGGSNWPLACD